MYKVDLTITQTINGLAGKIALLDVLMIWVSAVGVPILILLVAGQWWRKKDRSQLRHVLVASGFSFALGLALNQLILLVLHRARPYVSGVTHLIVARSNDPSFPSDHATASAAIASAFLLHGDRRTGVLFSAATMLIMISRIYVGTHYATDVLGGALTGVFAAVLVRRIYVQGTPADRLITSVF